jgi:archaellum component FlaG (FlaF/FlaG flagellin family)
VQGSIENSNMPVTSDIDFTLYKGWTRIYTTIGASVSGSLINATASLSVSISNKAPKNADMAWYFSTDFNLLSLPFKAPLSEEQKTIVENFFNNVR